MDGNQLLLDSEREGLELLKDFGLDSDESRVYLGLLRMGPSKASEVSHFTKTDRVRGYKILENLKNQGYVTSTLSSPILFSANDHLFFLTSPTCYGHNNQILEIYF